MSKRDAGELTPEQSAVIDDLIDHMFDLGCAKSTEFYDRIQWDRLEESDVLVLMFINEHEEKAEQHKDWCFVHRSKLEH